MLQRQPPGKQTVGHVKQNKPYSKCLITRAFTWITPPPPVKHAACFSRLVGLNIPCLFQACCTRLPTLVGSNNNDFPIGCMILKWVKGNPVLPMIPSPSKHLKVPNTRFAFGQKPRRPGTLQIFGHLRCPKAAESGVRRAASRELVAWIRGFQFILYNKQRFKSPSHQSKPPAKADRSRAQTHQWHNKP